MADLGGWPMGTEIGTQSVTREDFARFGQRLAAETQYARTAYDHGLFADAQRVAGFELEACLIDRGCLPAARNVSFLARLNSSLVVPELSRFNVEINATPQQLQGSSLSRLESELTATWQQCQRVAAEEQGSLIAIGILPTLRDTDLSLANMSPSRRYAMLNDQILRLRGGRPLTLSIEGADRIATTHTDVMLEAATTSFQAHLQTPACDAARTYNASLILAAPLVALSANSPFLFGRALWQETRIPLFEQAVDCCDPGHPEYMRVTFGSGYLGADPTELFAENLSSYAVLLPFEMPGEIASCAHLRLHNGTIWRWNRLLVGFDDNGRPHLRVEQRVMPAGPSIVDMIANAAFYYGAVHSLTRRAVAPERELPFTAARANFYCAARSGLGAELTWLGGRRIMAGELLARELLPLARQGLAELELAVEDRRRYLGVIDGRLRSGRNGAAWQLAHYAKYHDFLRLTADYLAHQSRIVPVHEWPI